MITVLNDVAFADCKTPLEADTGALLVLHRRLTLVI